MRWSLEYGMMVRRTRAPADGAPRIVWVHGLGESSVSFEPVIAAMPGFEHVLVDLPGYGRSPWPERAMNLEEMADQIAGWLPPEAFVIGHSMGGVLATLVAERASVRGIVNIDGNISIGDCTFSSKAAAIDDPVRALATVRDAVYRDGANRADLRGYHAAMMFAMPAMFHQHARDLVAMSKAETLAGRIAKLHALFVAGVPDGICEASRAMLTTAGARWVGIEPAGHWVYLDQTQRFVDEVTRFIQGA
jgi:pimeloyl-ACP methyl ester carboxylesterase